MRRGALVALVLASIAGCSGAPPPVETRPRPPGDCGVAADLRDRVPALLAKGKLDRAVRVIEKANRLCAASAAESWAAQVTTLVELGRYTEARALAAEIEKDASAPAAAKQAAAAARKDAEARSPILPDTEETRRLYAEALAVADRPDAASQRAAAARFLGVWEKSHPSGLPLASAGLATLAAGDAPAAQRLFDRAAVDFGAARAPTREPAQGLLGYAIRIAASRDGRRVVVAHPPVSYAMPTGVSILDGRTLRETVRNVGRPIVALDVSRDGRLVATALNDHTVHVWDAASGALVLALADGSGDVEKLAFSPDGKRLAAAFHSEVLVWDTATGNVAYKLLGSTAAAFSPDGKLLATGSPTKAVTLWDTATGTRVSALDWATDWVRHVAFSPDGKRLAAGSYDAVRLWDASTGAVIRSAEARELTALAFSPDSAFLAAGAGPRTIIFAAGTGAVAATLEGGHPSFSPDGRLVATAGVKVWEAGQSRLVRAFEGNEALFLGDGRLLVTNRETNTLATWDPRGAAPTAETTYQRPKAPEGIAFSPDGKRLATAGDDNTVRLWDLARAALLPPLEGHGGPIGAVAFSRDGKWLASASQDKTARLWDAATGGFARALGGHPAAVTGVAFSPDGKLLATLCNDAIRLFDPATGALVRTLKQRLANDRDPGALAFTPDGARLISSVGEHLRLWDVATGGILEVVEAPRWGTSAIVFAPDGKRFATSDGGSKVHLWDAASLKVIEERKHAEWVGAIAFASDGQRLAAAGAETVIHDAAGKTKITLRFGASRAIAFSPDGSLLATSGDDGAVILFRASDYSQLAALHAVPKADAGFLLDREDHVDFAGKNPCAARSFVVCRAGSNVFPLDVCEDRARLPGLLSRALQGKRADITPEDDPAPMQCP